MIIRFLLFSDFFKKINRISRSIDIFQLLNLLISTPKIRSSIQIPEYLFKFEIRKILYLENTFPFRTEKKLSLHSLYDIVEVGALYS